MLRNNEKNTLFKLMFNRLAARILSFKMLFLYNERYEKINSRTSQMNFVDNQKYTVITKNIFF